MPLEECSLCGLCKAKCPVFKAILKETVSPRGKAILIKKDVLDKAFYICNLCGACSQICPANVKLDSTIRKRRELLVEKGVESVANKKLVENVKKTGNAYKED